MTNSVSKPVAAAAVAVVVLIIAAAAWFFFSRQQAASNAQSAGPPVSQGSAGVPAGAPLVVGKTRGGPPG